MIEAWAIQERAVSENQDAGPQGKGWQADIAFTLEARNKVQAVVTIGGGMMHNPVANDNTPSIFGKPLRFLSVCSGIEAASSAWKQLNWECIGVAEIEPFPCMVLNHHYGASRPVFMPDPDEPGLKIKDQRARKAAIRSVSVIPAVGGLTNWGDFTMIDTRKLGQVDILAGGTPCQAFSIAGLRQSLADARGNLTLEFVRLAHELADGNGLRNAVWENVVGVLSTKDNAFGCFLAGLVGADTAIEPSARGKWPRHGMVSGPKGRAAWAVKDAQFFGVPQRRRRVLVVADFGNGADPAAVLFEPEGVFRHPPSRGEAGKDVAHPVAKGAGIGGDMTPSASVAPCLRARGNASHRLDSEAVVGYAPEIARCDATREGSSQDYESTTMVAVEVAPTMRAGGNTTGGDRPYGTDVDTCDSLAIVHAIQAGALRTNPHSGPDGIGVQADIAYTLEARSEVQAVCVTGDVTHSLTAEGHDASEDGSGRGAPIVAFDWYASASPVMPINEFAPPLKTTMQPAVAFAENSRAEVRLEGGDGQTVGCIGAGGGKPGQGYPAVLTSAVRRLTPMECERLQGFPDGYTRIPLRAYATKKVTKNRPDDMWSFITDANGKGKWWLMSADGPRYKALGNSWAVPKFVWLGRRIAQFMPKEKPAAANNNDNDGVRDGKAA